MMQFFVRTSLTALLAASVGAHATPGDNAEELVPNKIHHRMHDGELNNHAATAGSTGSITPAITWHGGPVLTTPNVHLIWYGNWTQANGSDNAIGQSIVRDFLYGVSGSGHMAINKGYTGSGSTRVSGALGSVFEGTDTGSRGTRLKDADITTIVSSYITKTGIKDPNAVYFVLTSSDVNETSGFCTKYCGWHTAGTIQAQSIKYSFVGNANRCLGSCSVQTVGPNGNAGVDGMISVLMHELEESLSDPKPSSGWADSGGAENGDKCAWTFGGNQKTASNGALYNVTLPAVAAGTTRNYMIQRNLDIFSKCYVDYVTGQQ